MGATRSPFGVSLGFRLSFLGLLGLDFLLPSAIYVVVGEAERAVRQHVGTVPSVLLLLHWPDLGGRPVTVRYHEEGESVLLPGVSSGLFSSSLVGRHIGVAPCPSSSLLELRVPVAGSPHR
jgi:hypothetical protein